MIILGIDPGTRSMGYGLIELKTQSDPRAIHFGAIRPKASLPLYARLGEILQRLEELMLEYKPGAMAIEKSFAHKNLKTAISMGEARGVVLALAGKYDLPLHEFSPTSVKQSVLGHGRADKSQIQKMVAMILNLPHNFKTDDESDALAIALTWVYRRKKHVCLH